MFTPRLQELYCTNIIETIPGDGFNERSEQFARTMPMIAPTFAKMNADQHAFFVPGWQLNENFDDFITGGEKGDYIDKMPYIRVEDLYLIVYGLLSYCGDCTTAQSFEDEQDLTLADYIEALFTAQGIIEHCDLLRAVPFVLPDFIIPNNDNFGTVAAANLSAFTSANSHLNGSTLRVNLLPFGAYLKVWCEFFRDENLCVDFFDLTWKGNHDFGGPYLYGLTGYVDFSEYPEIDFTDSSIYQRVIYYYGSLFSVKKRAWKKDYFTAALPFTQKGPDVLLPLSGTFPVDFNTPNANLFNGDAVLAGSTGGTGVGLSAGTGAAQQQINASVELGASALGSTIVDVRRAFALEEFYEADGRGGNRYPENTLVQFGVRTPDSRLPRAQFLGSNSSPVQISEVVQTSSTDQTSPQGTLAGKGTSYGNNRLLAQYFTMHGFLLNLYSIRTSAVYEQGIHPMFSRFDRTEYAWPRFAHLGEQPVYTKELFVGASTAEDDVFGYEPRYSEYKSDKSSVHGLLKGSLNFWTMSRRFASTPQLNEEFIYNSPRLDNFAVTSELTPPLVVEIDYRIRANRMLPFFGVPMI